MKNHSGFALLSGQEGMKPIAAIYNFLRAMSRGGPYWGMPWQCARGGRIPTIDGVEHYIPEWDLIIAHPPCTYLSMVGNRMHSPRRNSPDRITRAALDTIDGAAFFMQFVLLDCPKVAIENPVGVMSTIYRKPDQIINPSDFVDSMEDPEYVRKGTCLWLKGLPLLKKTNDFPTPSNARNGKWGGKGKNIGWVESQHKGKVRSKTFFSIAKAMAEQWG